MISEVGCCTLLVIVCIWAAILDMEVKIVYDNRHTKIKQEKQVLSQPTDIGYKIVH